MCVQYLAERRQNVTEFLDVAMATFLPAEYAERSRIYDEDMQQLASSSNVRNKRERELFFCYFFSYSIVTQSDDIVSFNIVPHFIIFNSGVTV